MTLKKWAKFSHYLTVKNPYNYGLKLNKVGLYHLAVKILGPSAKNMPYGILMKLWNIRNYFAMIKSPIALYKFLNGCTAFRKVFSKKYYPYNAYAWYKYMLPKTGPYGRIYFVRKVQKHIDWTVVQRGTAQADLVADSMMGQMHIRGPRTINSKEEFWEERKNKAGKIYVKLVGRR